jgi:enterochelin esterase family protein
MNPYKAYIIAAIICAASTVTPEASGGEQGQQSRGGKVAPISQIRKYPQKSHVARIQDIGKPRFNLRRIERQQNILKRIQDGRDRNERMQEGRREAEQLMRTRTTQGTQQLRKATVAGRATRFLEAPLQVRSLRPSVAQKVASSNLLIDGNTQDTTYVGNPITATFSFAPNAVSAVAYIYCDVDGDGLIGTKDFLLTGLLLLDNDDNDQNSADGLYELRLTDQDFFTHFVGSFVVELNDYQAVSKATVVLRPKPASSIVRVTVSPAFPGLMWYISGVSGGVYMFSDSTGSFSFYVDRQAVNVIYLTAPTDWTGVSNGYLPPADRSVSLTSDTTNISLMYAEAASFVEGYVRDQFGSTVAGVTVGAYNSTYTIRTQSDAAGYYKIGLAPGVWHLDVWQGESSDYIAVPSNYQALTVASGATIERDLLLLHCNSTITGKALFNGQGVGGIPIAAYSDTLYNSALTSTDGLYTLQVYSPPANFMGYTVSAYVGNGYYIPVPDRFSIQPGATGVDFAISKVTGGIQGRITDQSTGLPVSYANVYLSGTTQGKSTVSNDSGYYKVSLQNDVYSISVNASNYYSYMETGITISGSMVTRNIALQRSGSISGTVTNSEGSAISYASIYVTDTSGYYYAYGSSDSQGKYTVSGLSTSRYKVQCSSGGYVAEWYDNVYDFEHATTVAVTEGLDTPNIDFVLSRGGSISGTILDKSGAPLTAVEVDVFDTAFVWKSYAMTNDSGKYIVYGLATGKYHVRTYSLLYFDQWYDGADSQPSAKTVNVTIDQNTPGIDFVLLAGGTISGSVKTKQGVPISSAGITLLDSTFTALLYSYTDNMGLFSASRLKPGIKLYVYVSAYGYASRWYNNVSSPDSATAIILEEHETRENIDLILPIAGGISGKVRDDAGNPLSYTGVDILDPLGNYVSYGYTDSQGMYQAMNLSGGSYFATTYYYGYDQQWYDHKASLQQADDITVVDEQTTADIDFDLQIQGTAYGPEFLAFRARVEDAPVNLRPAIVDSFMAAVPAFPYIEQDTIACFLYRGIPGSVTIPGDANEWNTASYSMKKLSTTNLWYLSVRFESDARLEYKFYADGVWLLDPLNTRTWLGPYGPNSELRMPKYVAPEEVEFNPSIPHGSLRDTSFSSAILGNTRTISIYTPPGYSGSSNDSLCLVVFHDGGEYRTPGQANNVLDYLTANNKIQPTLGVFVPPVNRDAEYVGDQQNQYAAFIATELIPWIDLRYPTSRDPLKRATVGVSNGGNIALWICNIYPNKFGNAGSFSGNIQTPTIAAYQNSTGHFPRLYIDDGTYETYIRYISQEFVAAVQSKPVTLRYLEWHEGHTWGNWRAHLDNALRFFNDPTDAVAGSSQALPVSFQLLQNYPNPFNPTTTIAFDVSKSRFVTLKVFNLVGQEIATVISENLMPGSYRYSFDASRLASGVYIYCLCAGDFVQARKMILLK